MSVTLFQRKGVYWLNISHNGQRERRSLKTRDKRMAERIKMAIGSAYPLPEEQSMTLRGRNLIAGLPEAVDISSVEVREALSSPVAMIVEELRAALEQTPPELAAASSPAEIGG